MTATRTLHLLLLALFVLLSASYADATPALRQPQLEDAKSVHSSVAKRMLLIRHTSDNAGASTSTTTETTASSASGSADTSVGAGSSSEEVEVNNGFTHTEIALIVVGSIVGVILVAVFFIKVIVPRFPNLWMWDQF